MNNIPSTIMRAGLLRCMLIASIVCIFWYPTFLFAQENGEIFSISNYVNQSYRDFPMMKISIVPPVGFAKDTDQVGFLDPRNGAAIRAEEKKMSVIKTTTAFLKFFDSTGYSDSLGMKLLESFQFRINGYQAKLVSGSGKIEGEDYKQWWMFLGDSSETYIIKGFVPFRKQNELEQKVRAALLSVFYEPDRRLIPPGTDPTTTSSSSCNCHN